MAAELDREKRRDRRRAGSNPAQRKLVESAKGTKRHQPILKQKLGARVKKDPATGSDKIEQRIAKRIANMPNASPEAIRARTQARNSPEAQQARQESAQRKDPSLPPPPLSQKDEARIARRAAQNPNMDPAKIRARVAERAGARQASVPPPPGTDAPQPGGGTGASPASQPPGIPGQVGAPAQNAPQNAQNAPQQAASPEQIASDQKQTTIAPDGTKTTIQAPPGTAPPGTLPPPPEGSNPNVPQGVPFTGPDTPASDASQAAKLSPEAAAKESERKANDPRYQAASSGIAGMVQGHEDRVIENSLKSIDDEALRNDPETRVQVMKQLKEFGSYPGMDDPDAPAPTIRPNKPSFNPYTGKMTRQNGPSYKNLLRRPGDKTREDYIQEYHLLRNQNAGSTK